MLEKMGEIKRKHAGKIVILVLILFLFLFIMVQAAGGKGKIANSTEARIGFLKFLGWEADPKTEECGTVVIPDCENHAMAEYNALMQKGGYDLSPYIGKCVEQYRYELTNYPNARSTVYAVLYVSKGRVIGGDIHTASIDGFMHELRENEQQKGRD